MLNLSLLKLDCSAEWFEMEDRRGKHDGFNACQRHEVRKVTSVDSNEKVNDSSSVKIYS